MSTTPLGEFEHHVLLAILRLADQAYGVTIRSELSTCTGRAVTPGAIYTTLDRMEEKGLVESVLGDATAERGGRAKRYYHVTAQGLESVRQAQKALLNLWDGLTILGVQHA